MIEPRRLLSVIKQFEQVVRQKMDFVKTPGLAAAFTDREETLWEGYFGYARLDNTSFLQPFHRFPIGSDGKLFTALAVMQQVEAGRLDLDTPLTRYLPWFKTKNSLGEITLHHLLTHTAGLPAGIDFAPSGLPHVWNLHECPVVSAPGERYRYSDVGYKIIGLVLETVLGQPYPQIIQTHILDPLGMTQTYPSVASGNRLSIATGYTCLYGDRPPHRTYPLVEAPWVEMDSADGCIASTASDMATFLRMLLNRGQPLISPASFERLIHPHVTLGEGLSYGYGIISTVKEGFTRLTHGGDTPGFQSSWRLDLDNGLAALVLMNGPLASGLSSFGLQSLRAAASLQTQPALPPVENPAQVENASDFEGVYFSKVGHDAGPLRVAASQGQLVVSWEEGDSQNQDRPQASATLEEVFPDCFQTTHPRFSRFLLTFNREEGAVVEAFWGPEWFVNERYRGETEFSSPPEWAGYAGFYSSFSPWQPNFRVVLRKGDLWLLATDGSDEQKLFPTNEPGYFQVGENSPEFIRFDMTVENQTHRVNRSGGDFYRNNN